MTDAPTTTENPGTVNLSTTLQPGTYDTAYGAGKMDAKPDEPAKPESLDDVLRDEIKKQDEAKPEKPEADPKAKPEAKVEEKPEAKPDPEAAPKTPVKDVEPARDGKEAAGREKPPSEGEKVHEPPARLLPKAREVWANVPREVKAEWDRFEREVATERETYKEAAQFHEELKEYREMAKQVGTTVPFALKRYVEFDKQIAQDFGRGMAAIAADQGKSPADAVASLLRGLGSSPEQYAKHVLANPQAHRQPAPQAQPRPQNDPLVQRLAMLEQRLEGQEHERVRDQTLSSVVTPFAEAHPRFDELSEDIAKLLKSGMIPTSMDKAAQLEVAYDMAERLRPSPRQPQAAFADPAPAADPTPDAGRKSVRGAPSDGLTPRAEDDLPLEAFLRQELRKMG
jgi:hypothetical protein